MSLRFILIGIFFTTTTSINAAERFQMNFKLTQEDNIIEWGKTIVSRKPHTFSKGLKSSYLKLRCQQQSPGEILKLYSIVDHFSGLQLTHQLIGNNIELNVVRSVVQARLIEIRALTRKECKDMSPIVTTTTKSYRFPLKNNMSESHPFGENMTFHITTSQ